MHTYIYTYIHTHKKQMSAQCWCFHCAGKVVSRNTFKNHGRKFKPDPPIRKRKIDMVSMPDDNEDQECHPVNDNEDPVQIETDEAWGRVFSRTDNTHEFGRGNLNSRQVLMLLLDWMCSHKATDESARSVWSIV